MSASLGAEPAILLVDDNPHDVVLLRLAFRRVGIIDPIKLVKDGADAVRYLRGEGVYSDRHAYPAPTLMLLDLKMPHTSGFDVLQWVRTQPSLKLLTVVVMTGSKDSEDVQRAYQLGADSYLVKPTKFSDLVKITQSLKSYCSVADKAVGSPGDGQLKGFNLPTSGRPDQPQPNVPGNFSHAL